MIKVYNILVMINISCKNKNTNLRSKINSLIRTLPLEELDIEVEVEVEVELEFESIDGPRLVLQEPS